MTHISKTVVAVLAPLCVMANFEFCRIRNSSVEYAPDWLLLQRSVTNVVNSVTNVTSVKYAEMRPSYEQYISAGWFVNRIVQPPVSNGFITTVSEYMCADDHGTNYVYAVYSYTPEPERVHTYRKSYLAQWMYSKGKWETFNTLLAKSETAKFFWDTSTEFDSSHPQWTEILTGISSGLELTDAEQTEMLKYGENGN